jgi:hypothetical protein
MSVIVEIRRLLLQDWPVFVSIVCLIDACRGPAVACKATRSRVCDYWSWVCELGISRGLD